MFYLFYSSGSYTLKRCRAEEVEVLQAAADPSKAKVLKKTGGMNKNILQSELLMFLSSVPQVERLLAAELEEIVEDAMIEKLDVGNYEEFWWRPTVAVHWDAGRLEPVMTRQLPHRYGHLAIDEENQLYAVGSKVSSYSAFHRHNI